MNKNKKAHNWWDVSWNPIVGCSAISPGCAHCYAEAISKRFGLPWGHPELKEERLTEPGKVEEPSLVFVCSMSDLFHEANPFDRIDLVLAQTEIYDWHTYVIITKRPHLVKRWHRDSELGWGNGWPENVWLGVSAENQTCFDQRYESLKDLPVHKMVSCEPLLGHIRLNDKADYIEWVIVGPETGPKARPSDLADIVSLEKECNRKRTAFFNKARWAGTVVRQYPMGMQNKS